MSTAAVSLTGDHAEMTTLDPTAVYADHASPTDLLTAAIKQDSIGMCEAVCRNETAAELTALSWQPSGQSDQSQLASTLCM